ncbi:ferritin-like protein [Saccharothrix sp. S26]|uniref:ferritin-like domain-containing protein n=1 Tax=Saccharothrix sp. S26 TaxID=2907215 RepID=UPI001F292063|nr:ferritin-like protein [Saccharothrix sp. S26]MCE6998110.1 ferritin-like protein [Saccharothrix sp. S26]
MHRHLASVVPELFADLPPAMATLSVAGALDAEGERPVLPPEFNWRDYTVMLLHVAAEIEHSLMVQYLFAAYSMGGPQVPEELRDDVRRWQEIILGIAKEEMGHLVTVQNLLTALGGPMNLDREDYPWGSDFYPFAFSLRPLSARSLATYVVAESPETWSGPEAEAIKEVAADTAGQYVNRVGALYGRIDSVLKNKDFLPDELFHAETLPYQASWDEWGRGYTRGQRGQEAGNVPDVASPQLLVFGVFSRDSARKALHEIGEQGEAPDVDEQDETSHFNRFLGIYRALAGLPPEQQALVARRVAENPVTAHRLNEVEAADRAAAEVTTSPITDPFTALWGHLFNLRYRMLLTDIAHAFRLAGPLDNGGVLTGRGALVHRAFAEMYNLRAVAGRLVELPLERDVPDGLRAGPTFEMPYSLELPHHDHDCWLLQRDLVQASRLLVDQLVDTDPASARDPYLIALRESDQRALEQIEHVLGRKGCTR